MRPRYVWMAAVAMTVAAYALFWPATSRMIVEPGTSLQAVLDRASPGTTVVVAPGRHEVPVELPTRVDLTGEAGATIVSPPSADAGVSVLSSGSRVSGLRLEGASTGILVREVTGVVIEEVEVSGAELHGIEVVDGSVRIASSTVDDLRHPMAQGIEIRNSDGRPDSVIDDVRVSGGQEGIVSHVSEVVVRNSHVSDTTMRAIAITEMSDGAVSGNTVTDVAGSGLFCGDMSRCAFDNNVATDVAVGAGSRSSAGWGLVVSYHSSASNLQNELGGDAGEVVTLMGSRLLDRSPLDPASPFKLAGPLAFSALVGLCVAALGYLVSSIWTRRHPPRPVPRPTAMMLLLFLAVLVVQSFHMVEHLLQVYRVHVDLIPSRGGLVGPAVTSEWVHLAYNGAVMLFLLMSFNGSRGSVADGRVKLLGSAVLIQGWHSVEHIAKVTQHVLTGYPANPGLLGRFTDLVWFHFTINLTVYGLCVAVAISWLVQRARVDRIVAEPALA